MNARRSFSHGQVYAGLVVSLLLAAGAAAFIYARYVRFDPVAERHLPDDVSFALRLNVEQAVVYEPFRQHILPLLEWGRQVPETRLSRFEKETTIELGVDLRELLLAETEQGQWLVLLGGHFPREGVAAGTARMLKEEGLEGQVLPSPERLVLPSGVSFGATGDGVLVLASSEELLLDALAAHAPPFQISSDAALESFSSPSSGAPEVRVRISPGQSFPVEVTCLFGEQELSSRPACPPSRAAGPALQLDQANLRPAADSGASAEPGKVTVSGHFERNSFDRAVAGLADTILGWLRNSG
jgi:hypothetical protein